MRVSGAHARARVASTLHGRNIGARVRGLHAHARASTALVSDIRALESTIPRSRGTFASARE